MKRKRAPRALTPTNDAVPKMACGHPVSGPVWVLADPVLFGRELGIEIKQCMAKLPRGGTCGKLISMALIQPSIAQPPVPPGPQIIMP